MAFVRFFFRALFKGYELLLKMLMSLRHRLSQDPSEILIQRQSSDHKMIEDRLLASKLTSAPPKQGQLLVLIPFRDGVDLTRQCVDSLLSQTLPADIKMTVALIDNQSKSSDTARYVKSLVEIDIEIDIEINNPSKPIFRHIKADYEFNFSRLNNDAWRQCREASPDWVLLLNNDVELVSPRSIIEMISVVESSHDIGVVGATLVFPDDSVQHLFAAPGVKIVAAHPLKGVPRNLLKKWFEKDFRIVPSVTAACMMLRASDFDALQGLDEAMASHGQDIDLCLKLLKAGKYPVVATNVVAIHHESRTRAPRVFPRQDIKVFYERWGQSKELNQFYSNDFSRWVESPVLKLAKHEPPYPWWLVI
jgi:GT2 family glycosyltransferase